MKRYVRKATLLVKRVPHKITSLLGMRPSSADEARRRNNWDKRWGDDGYRPSFMIGEADASVRRAVEDGWFPEGTRGLDIGCGDGFDAAWLAEHGLEAVGIDFSRHAVERARARFAGVPNLSYEVVDVIEPGAYPETFDAIVDRGCLHGLDKVDYQRYVDNLAGWATAGSRLLLIWRNKQDSDDKVVARARKILGSSFDLVDEQSVDLSAKHVGRPLPAVAMRFIRVS